MKAKLRLSIKLLRIALLFGHGLLLAALAFPTLDFFYSKRDAKARKDRIKTRWLRRFGAIVNLQVNMEGGLPERRAMLVSNHISWLDILVIGQCLPAYFAAKSDIAGWPVIGYLAKQGGTIFIERGNKQQIKTTSERMTWLLRQNGNIIAFPEGTTTRGDVVLNFHSSLFQPALLTRSLIQPVAIRYSGAAKEHAPYVDDDVFVRHLIKMLTLDKIEVQLSFLPVLDGAGKNRHILSAEARNMIEEKVLDKSLTAVRASINQ